MSRQARIEVALFGASWLAFAFFHQGGNWNQNARFAMVRAMVEQARLSIDDYLVYARDEASPTGLRRARVVEGTVRWEGAPRTLAWSDAAGRLEPVSEAAGGARPLALQRVAVSGDVAFAQEHFHPNKAPGTALLALPAYLLLHGMDRLLERPPDDWWVLTRNAWLCSVGSVGLLCALGCVLFFRLALSFCEGSARPALLATISYALGTMFWPQATLLQEHGPAAVGLLAGFYLIERDRSRPGTLAQAHRNRALAGGAAGLAVLCSYAAAGGALLLGIYLAASLPRRGSWRGYALGLLVPLLLLGLYHGICYGSPFSTGYQHENPLFRRDDALLGVFGAPSPEALVGVLFSPFRGLFLASPVLAMALVGAALLWQRERHRPELLLCAAMVGFFLLVNASFLLWHGGWGVFPRYLAPALPFLALPLAAAFARLPRSCALLATVSIAVVGLHTAVDPQSPVGVSSIAAAPGPTRLSLFPLTRYTLPLFLTGRPGPALDAEIEERIAAQARSLESRGVRGEVLEQRLADHRARIEERVARGESRLPLARYVGPVSASPLGVYEGFVATIFPPGSPQERWNSFNVGEFLFPGSRLSLLPLLAFVALPLAFALRESGRGRP